MDLLLLLVSLIIFLPVMIEYGAGEISLRTARIVFITVLTINIFLFLATVLYSKDEHIVHYNILEHKSIVYSTPQTFIQTRIIRPSWTLRSNNETWTNITKVEQ